MKNVREGGNGQVIDQQLPLFDEVQDPLYCEDPTGKITPEQARAILSKQGLDISEEQAEIVLLFLYQLSNIIVSKFLQNEQDS
jgi:hypothetical protein